MRVISGKYKGKNIDGFDIEGTRPTQDRVKESLFGMIQDYIDSAKVLDLFAGSGNLGIEALSNGADSCIFVDNNRKCIECIKKNTNGIDNVTILENDYLKALDTFKNKYKFDLIFLDPPYNLECLDKILNIINDNNLLEENGLVICEYEYDNFKNEYSNLELIKEKKYGYKNIKIYRSK